MSLLKIIWVVMQCNGVAEGDKKSVIKYLGGDGVDDDTCVEDYDKDSGEMNQMTLLKMMVPC